MRKDYIDQIIELFCVVDDRPESSGVWGMDTELFSSRQEARKSVIKILKKHMPFTKKDIVLKWCKNKNYVDKHEAWAKFNRIMSYTTMNCAINQHLKNSEVSD